MKASIIGCNGYIGKHLSFFLTSKGWDIYGYDIFELGEFENMNYQQIDIKKRDDLARINTDVDFVFYFSGITGTSKAFNDFDLFIDVNEKGLLNILNKIRLSNSKARIIFPSTRLIYKGFLNKQLNEDSEKEFSSIYALNKWFGEQVVQQFSKYFNLEFSIFRIGVPYGNLLSGDYSYGTVGSFINKANSKEDIILYGDGLQKRTFTHIQDLCSQIFSVILNPKSINEIYNVDGETLSIKDIAEEVAEKYGVNVKYINWPEIDLKMESGDTIFDSKKIKSILNDPIDFDFKNWIHKLEI